MIQSAIFIDLENLVRCLDERHPGLGQQVISRPGKWIKEIDRLTSGLPVRFSSRRAIIRQCYAYPGYIKTNEPAFARNGIEIIDCHALTKEVKNAADIKIVVDIFKSIERYPNIEEYIILGDDTDYTPLSIELKKRGKNVVVFAKNDSITAASRFADHIIRTGFFKSCLIDVEPGQSRIVEKSQKIINELENSELLEVLRFLQNIANSRQGFVTFNDAHLSLIGHFPNAKDGDMFGYSDISTLGDVLQNEYRDKFICDKISEGFRIINDNLYITDWGFQPNNYMTQFVRGLLMFIDDPIPFVSPNNWNVIFASLSAAGIAGYRDDLELVSLVMGLCEADGLQLSSEDVWRVIDAIRIENCEIGPQSTESDYAAAWRMSMWEESGEPTWLSKPDAIKALVTWFHAASDNIDEEAKKFLAAIAD